jgi:hypothetical protein
LAESQGCKKYSATRYQGARVNSKLTFNREQVIILTLREGQFPARLAATESDLPAENEGWTCCVHAKTNCGSRRNFKDFAAGPIDVYVGARSRSDFR